ncbi:hypothetical protein PM082_010342 [Marasmius tenuissimus]|nr:hypothetical protein PM082_010342 [Marasmius tenuissimus]
MAEKQSVSPRFGSANGLQVLLLLKIISYYSNQRTKSFLPFIFGSLATNAGYISGPSTLGFEGQDTSCPKPLWEPVCPRLSTFGVLDSFQQSNGHMHINKLSWKPATPH